jgi:pimeloyl-ACP methyl ester carboxylesterase
VDFYKDEEARVISHASYERVMDLWPVGYEDQWVDTQFGRSHVVVSGPESGRPVILLPGLFADATMWFATVGPLAEEYRVYSVDLPVFGGKTHVSDKRVKTLEDYVEWFDTLTGRLEISRTALGGLSYGSWLALALARERPGLIGAVIMLDPSETFIRMDGGIAWRGFWDFAFFPNRTKYARFLAWMGGGYSDPKADIWVEHMLDVIEYGSVGMFDIPQHRIYTADELTAVTMPVLIMAGGKPILYKNPEGFAEAAAAALPHAEIEIVPGTGHSLNVEKAEAVNARIVQFLSANYR